MNFFRLAGSAIFTAAISLAASSAAWEMNSYQDFLRGKFTNISLTRDGRLMLGPRIETLLDSGEQAVWATGKAPDGSTYVATGHRGKLFRISPGGDKSLVWTSSQPEIFALAIDSKGVVYAGTSPDGKIHRIENGTATEYYTTKAKFVWSLLSINGTLYAGTDQGNVHKITGPNQGEIYYSSGQGHVTVLTHDKEGRLLAGTEPNGILYRITAKDKAFVLMDANLPELRTVIPAEDGSIYVAALGGSLAGRGLQTGTPASVNPIIVPGISVTVTEQASHGTIPTVDLPKPDQNQKVQPQPTPQLSAPVAATPEIAGVEKSAIYRIHPDNTVETLWSSKEENAYSLLRSGDYLVFGTDLQGRLYRLSADRKVTLLSETNESTITSLSANGTEIIATSSDQGKVMKLGSGYNGMGTYESPVHDSTSVARWGRYDWRAELCDQCKVKMETRSGNSSRPDRTWSDWSEVTTNQIMSPNARYLQWRTELSGNPGTTPVLESVTASYLPQNTAPVVRSISVMLVPPTASASKTATQQQQQQQAQTATFSVTVTDTADPLPATSSGTPSQILTRGGAQGLQLSWQADDADGDKLIYAIYFRGEGEREWKMLKNNIQENTLPLDSDALADGRYRFRVVASDRLMNAGPSARNAELISAPFLIDNTPPTVTIGAPSRQGQAVILTVTATDAASPIRRAEYSLDAGPWTPLDAADGILDSMTERIEVRLEALPPGEHLLAVRAYDSAGNAGLNKIVLR